MAKEDDKMQKDIAPLVKQINSGKTDRDKMVSMAMCIENITAKAELPVAMVVGVLMGVIQNLNSAASMSAGIEAFANLLGGLDVKGKKD